MFSYIDLVRGEIGLVVGEHFGIDFKDADTDEWRTLGDVARSVVQRVEGRVNEQEVFGWIAALIADGYGVTAALTPDEEVFSDYDRMTSWFFATSYPHGLRDRLFAKKRGDG